MQFNEKISLWIKESGYLKKKSNFFPGIYLVKSLEVNFLSDMDNFWKGLITLVSIGVETRFVAGILGKTFMLVY